MSASTCHFCGSASRVLFRGGEGFECGTSIDDDGPARRGANCLVLTEVQPLRDQVAVLTQERDELKSFVLDVRDNWDCDLDAHKYGTTCRSCEAKRLTA